MERIADAQSPDALALVARTRTIALATCPLTPMA
jgi:hypothetical protein